jgi:tetratricopeptide (TPR) repeat protein
MRTIFFLLLSVLFVFKSYCQTAEKYLQSGNELFSVKHFRDAILDYDDAIRLDPKNGYAYFYRGYSKANLEDYEGAILDFNEAIKRDSENGLAYYKRGFSKWKLGDYLGAMLDYTKSMKYYKKISTSKIELP